MTETITVQAGPLAIIMSNALVFAGKDDTLPVLAAVRLECEAGTLSAIATDRYSLGMDTADTEGDGTFQFLVRYADVQRIVKAAKEASKSAQYVETTATLTVEGDTLSVTLPGQTITAERVDGEFPRYRSLIPDAQTLAETPGVPHVALTRSNLARVGKIVTDSRTEPVRLYFTSPTRPVVIKLGRFVGLLMPCRIEWPVESAEPERMSVAV